MRSQGAIRGNGPSLYRPLPVVGYTQPDLRALFIMVDEGDISRRYQACNLGCDCRGRVAALLFPAFYAERRSMGYYKVRRGLDMVLIEAAIRHPKLVCHDDWIAGLVKLSTE